ncbi:alpha/beta hydrolase [Amorphus orientalis]|uniref:Phospholipase/carboxylesterase n=1 Tax=Amorphus orientalis TaxID=649198 RepID=A0AAE4ARZ3_9HYPH|nr:alpha/beta fold hydrolase [Amorphus orientalis]MDQ0314668.1 phospholipase/carboxylesterase [Amorphus orientalis]
MVELDGPRIEPAGEGKPRALVVLLHGYGADGSDLIELARMWAPALPDVAFVAPDAPDHCEMAPIGRQWFPLTLRDPSEYWRGVTAAAPLLDRFLDDQLVRYGLGADRLALVGFSQGTMMALHVGFRRAERIAGLIGYSGLMAGPDRIESEMTHRFPVLLVHGADDDLLPADLTRTTAEHLDLLKVPVSSHIEPGLGHGINEMGARLGLNFLTNNLPA